MGKKRGKPPSHNSQKNKYDSKPKAHLFEEKVPAQKHHEKVSYETKGERAQNICCLIILHDSLYSGDRQNQAKSRAESRQRQRRELGSGLQSAAMPSLAGKQHHPVSPAPVVRFFHCS